MAKTLFSSGVVVTSEWLNGARNIVFDGQDLDWHYDPLGLDDLEKTGPTGLDSRYVTLTTEQPTLSGTGLLLSGTPVSGSKVVTGYWGFGFDPASNPTLTQNYNKAPRSFLTNLKYSNANGISPSSASQKFAALADADLVTKKVLSDQLNALVVDNGTY
jgi:hypothetical protein